MSTPVSKVCQLQDLIRKHEINCQTIFDHVSNGRPIDQEQQAAEALLQEMVGLAEEVIVAEGNDLVHDTLKAFLKHCESWELEDSIGTRGQLVLKQVRGKDWLLNLFVHSLKIISDRLFVENARVDEKQQIATVDSTFTQQTNYLIYLQLTSLMKGIKRDKSKLLL